MKIIFLLLFSGFPISVFAQPPFVCSIWCEHQMSAPYSQDVIQLFEDAEQGKGPTLDLFYARLKNLNSTTQLSYEEVARRLLQINHWSFQSTPCFRMANQGLDAALPLFAD